MRDWRFSGSGAVFGIVFFAASAKKEIPRFARNDNLGGAADEWGG